MSTNEGRLLARQRLMEDLREAKQRFLAVDDFASLGLSLLAEAVACFRLSDMKDSEVRAVLKAALKRFS